MFDFAHLRFASKFSDRLLGIQASWAAAAALLALSFACAGSRVPAPPVETRESFVSKLTQILLAEDLRKADSSILRAFMTDPNPVLRQFSVRAAGRIRSLSYRNAIVNALSDQDASVRREAVFALGLGSFSGTAAQLIKLYQAEQDNDVRLMIIRMLGRTAEPEALSFLEDMLNSLSERTRVEAMLSLALLSMSGTLPSGEAFGRAIAMLSESSTASREAAALFIYNSSDPKVVEQLFAKVRDPSPVVRRYAALASSRAPLQDSVSLAVLLVDPEPMVRSAVMEVLADLKAPQIARSLPSFLSGYWEEYTTRNYSSRGFLSLLDASERLWNVGGEQTAIAFEEIFDKSGELLEELSSDPKREKAALIPNLQLLRCAAAAAIDATDRRVEKLSGCASATGSSEVEMVAFAIAASRLKNEQRLGVMVVRDVLASAYSPARVAAVRALGKLRSAEAVQLLAELTGHSDRFVAAAAAEQLSRAAKPEYAAAILLGSIRGKSFPVEAVFTVLGSLDSLFSETPALKVSPDLARTTLSTLLGHSDFAVSYLAARVLSAASGKQYLPSSNAASAIDEGIAADIMEAPETFRCQILTTKGEITIELLSRLAPKATRVFAALARRGFYDGTFFYRVSPGLAVYGGDPRGDGMGGPGFTLRDEINPTRFERGMVGLDISYPDTAASRFFIALTSLPELDFRRTAMGRVAEGMEVAASIVPGDRIISVTVPDQQ